MTDNSEPLVTHVVLDPVTGATETHTETAEEHAACLDRLHGDAARAQADHDAGSDTAPADGDG